jgi:hypothetical protein
VNWIGLTLELKPKMLHISISKLRVDELRLLTIEALAKNVISTKWLKSYAGKASSFASILVFWRPFLQFLWSAIYAPQSPDAPWNCVWVKQCFVSLKWILAFLNGIEGDMERTFILDVNKLSKVRVRMVFDASPWGAGGVLIQDDIIVAWFATEFDAHDAKATGVVFGGSESQQVAEALSILFGIRAWAKSWLGGAPRLEVRSDSVCALYMVARMKTHSPHVAVVAREMALTLSDACIRPEVVAHIPGVANKLADTLSRRFAPGVSFSVPAALLQVRETVIQPRTVGYYRSV